MKTTTISERDQLQVSLRMSWVCWMLVLAEGVHVARTATHDEIGRCALTGVYKMRQSVLESPLYPDSYPPNSCWDYVVRSPYRCPTKFHIQFLDFSLESSLNCVNDYLAVGLENDGDDRDLLCGQIVGIKKYHTPDGILRLRFRSDESPWTTGKGFKLLVTRLACEREDVAGADFHEVDDDSERVDALPLELLLPSYNRSTTFREFGNRNQYAAQVTLPAPGLHYPHAGDGPIQLSPPGVHGSYQPVEQQTSDKPCVLDVGTSWLQSHPAFFTEQYVSGDWTRQLQKQNSAVLRSSAESSIPEACCSSSFRQRRFYLSSPGFPRTSFTSLLPVTQRDCHFQLEKATPEVCRLRIEFKFFDFGQTSNGAGSGDLNNLAIGTTSDVCTEDFLEVDGERFCGCRTGYVFTALWGLGRKVLRLRMGNSGVPSSGFLLDIVQEQCSGAQSAQKPPEQIVTGFQTNGDPQHPVNQLQFGIPPLDTQFGIPLQNHAQQQPPNFYSPQQQQPPNSYSPQQELQSLFPQYPQPPLSLLHPEQQHASLVPYIPPPPPPLEYGLPPFQRVKRFSTTRTEHATEDHPPQPLTIVETNSTRKEFYYFDHDAFSTRMRPQGLSPVQRRTDMERRNFADAHNTRFRPRFFSRGKNRCHFAASDVLRLSVDVLWLTKPICYAPQRSWFSNIFG